MASNIIVGEKDRVEIGYDKSTGKYRVKVITLHDSNTAELFLRAESFLSDLNAGKVPKVINESMPMVQRFKCETCGCSDMPAFQDKPTRTMYYCSICKRWTWHSKTNAGTA